MNQVLLTVGGFNGSQAKRSSVELDCLNPDGAVAQRAVPNSFAQVIDEQSNPIARDDDTIVVSRSGATWISDTLNLFFSPVTGSIWALSLLERLGRIHRPDRNHCSR